jgi:hypothetical protein
MRGLCNWQFDTERVGVEPNKIWFNKSLIVKYLEKKKMLKLLNSFLKAYKSLTLWRNKISKRNDALGVINYEFLTC